MREASEIEGEIVYCVPWSYHGMAVWMAGEFFAEGGSGVAIKLTPGSGGVLQVFVDDDKIFDKVEENGEYPDMERVQKMRQAIREALSSD